MNKWPRQEGRYLSSCCSQGVGPRGAPGARGVSVGGAGDECGGKTRVWVDEEDGTLINAS